MLPSDLVIMPAAQLKPGKDFDSTKKKKTKKRSHRLRILRISFEAASVEFSDSGGDGYYYIRNNLSNLLRAEAVNSVLCNAAKSAQRLLL